MKNTLFITGLFLLLSFPSARGGHRCETDNRLQRLGNSNPRMYTDYLQRHAALLSRFQSQATPSGSRTIYTIPVVVHVVYENATENISDAQVLSQIDVLNEDFARLNADTVNTPAAFNVAGPTSFRFCLAQRDPDDNPTTGIVHHLTGIPVFSDTADDVKHAITGGADAWDVERYLNIWVCDLDSSITGYAEYPDWAPHTDTYGAVVNYRYFGRGGTAVAPFDLGRTATHMVAHCFGLHHIWGDDGGLCTSDDGIADTPTQADETTGCLTFPATDGCTTGGNGIMFMNYLDNSDDNCRNMFTLGQDGWMVFEMQFSFPPLLNSNGCQSVTLTDNDVWLRQIQSPDGQSCDLNVTPAVQIKNYGNVPITSVDISYAYDGGAASVYNWTGNLASLATQVIVLPTTTLLPGMHSVVIYTSNPNLVADPVTSNDTLSTSFELVGHGAAFPVTEDFESGTFPSPGWELFNPDLDYTWEATLLAAQAGAFSVFIDNYDYSNTGAYDEFDTPITDPSSVLNPALTFDVAYTYFYLPGPVPTITTDTLEVLISTDCGANFSRIYYKGGVDLSTTLPTDLFFVPTATEWRNEVIPLTAYAADSQVIIKFRNINNFGNNVYIDNVNLTNLTGVSAISATPARLFPNPASDAVTLRMGSLPADKLDLRIYDAMGRQVYEREVQQLETELSIDRFTPGLYNVQLSGPSYSTSIPLVVSRP